MNAKPIITSISTILAGAITLLSGAVQAQEVPRLRQNMPYSEAREILLNAGWQAIEIPPLQRGSNYSSTVKKIVDEFGFNEVVDCAGTGVGPCRFEFAAADGRKLVVVTVNGTRLILNRWMIEKGEPKSSSPKPVLRAENSSGKCTAALENARRRIETGRAIQVTEINSRDISNAYPDAPSGRPTHRYLIMEGAATTSVLRSGQFMKAIATDIIQNCNSTGMVTFALARSGYAITYGIFPGGRVDGFQCLEPGRGAKKPVWGEIYCT